MNGNMTARMNFEEYKRLTPDERELFLFQQLCKVDDICISLDGQPKKYAAKWVEHAMKTGIGSLVVGIAGVFFTILGNHFGRG